MKRSNLILLGALAAIFFFMTALQVRMNGYVKEEVLRDYGNFVDDARTLPKFENIAVTDGIKVFFDQNDTSSIQVEAREELLDFITTKVVDETLVIEKTKRMREKDSVSVFISNPKLDSLNVNSASFYTKGLVMGNVLKMVFSDGADGNLELTYELLECSFSESSNVSLTGNSKKMNFMK